jgi:hypothetical protein
MHDEARLVIAAVSAALIACLGLASPAGAATLPDPVSCSGCWKPALNTSWQWQLKSVPSAPYLDVAMYDIDGFDATAADVSTLHRPPALLGHD